jgi:hypothetical protein
MQSINCSSLGSKLFFSLWGFMVVFYCYQIVALKEDVHKEGKVPCQNLNDNPWLHASLCPSQLRSSKILSREMIATHFDSLEIAESLTHSIA